MNIFGQMVRAQLENRTSDPANPAPGMIYFNTVTACPRHYDGTRWVQPIASGKIEIFAGPTMPAGYLPLGQSFLRSDYPTLFAEIGLLYTATDDGVHFSTPPAAGRAIAIAGTGAGLPTLHNGDTFGSQHHTLTNAEMPPHNHGGSTGNDSPDHSHSVPALATPGWTPTGSSFNFATNLNNNTSWQSSGASTRHAHGIASDGGSGGVAQPFDLSQPSIAFNAYIKI